MTSAGSKRMALLDSCASMAVAARLCKWELPVISTSPHHHQDFHGFSFLVDIFDPRGSSASGPVGIGHQLIPC